MSKLNTLALVLLVSLACGDEQEEKTWIKTGKEARTFHAEQEKTRTQPAAPGGEGDKTSSSNAAPAAGASTQFVTEGAAILIKVKVGDPAKLAEVISKADKKLRALGVISYKLTVEKNNIVGLLFVTRTKDGLKALSSPKSGLEHIGDEGTFQKTPPPLALQSEIVQGDGGNLPASTATCYATFKGIGPGWKDAVAADKAVRKSSGILAYRVHRNLDIPGMRVIEFVAKDEPTLKAYLKKSKLGRLPSAPKERSGFTAGPDVVRAGPPSGN